MGTKSLFFTIYCNNCVSNIMLLIQIDFLLLSKFLATISSKRYFRLSFLHIYSSLFSFLVWVAIASISTTSSKEEPSKKKNAVPQVLCLAFWIPTLLSPSMCLKVLKDKIRKKRKKERELLLHDKTRNSSVYSIFTLLLQIRNFFSWMILHHSTSINVWIRKYNKTLVWWYNYRISLFAWHL